MWVLVWVLVPFQNRKSLFPFKTVQEPKQEPCQNTHFSYRETTVSEEQMGSWGESGATKVVTVAVAVVAARKQWS